MLTMAGAPHGLGARVSRNQPGSWDVFIGHSRRSGQATTIASKLFADLTSAGFSCWLDVNMGDMSTAAMEEGVVGSRFFLAIVTGPCVNPDCPDDTPETNAYFARPYCLQELRWAIEAGVKIQPIVRSEDKPTIGEFMDAAPSDLKVLGEAMFIDLNYSDREYWQVGLNKIIRTMGSSIDGSAAGGKS